MSTLYEKIYIKYFTFIICIHTTHNTHTARFENRCLITFESKASKYILLRVWKHVIISLSCSSEKKASYDVVAQSIQEVRKKIYQLDCVQCIIIYLIFLSAGNAEVM